MNTTTLPFPRIIIILFVHCAPLFAQVGNTDMYSTDAEGNEQYVIDILYPLYVTEITTNDGRVFRGRLTGSNADSYFIDIRSTGELMISRASVKEIAWAVGDRREYNFFTTVSFPLAYSGSSEFGLSPGLNISYGIEFLSNWLVQLDYTASGFFPASQNDVYGVLLSVEGLLGYRFNRNETNFHTLALGGGAALNNFYDEFGQTHTLDDRYPLVFSALYDYEFPIGEKTGMSMFARFQYFNQNPRRSHVLLGISFRFYAALPTTRQMSSGLMY